MRRWADVDAIGRAFLRAKCAANRGNALLARHAKEQRVERNDLSALIKNLERIFSASIYL